MTAGPVRYRVCRVGGPAEREDEIAAAACAAGSLGAWVVERSPSEVRLDCYFPALATREVVAEFLERARELGACELAGLGPSEIAERDWLEAYRRTARPVRVGPFLLDPSEPDDRAATRPAARAGELTIRLPARRAFGTGSHESTRLVLEELIELRAELASAAVLDVGCGTGVLSFAARLLGAARAVAFDNDRDAVAAAAANCRLNRLPLALFAGSADALRAPACFDVAVVNVIPEHLAGREPSIVDAVRPGGLILASGILAERAEPVLDAWRAAGAVLERRRLDGEWLLLRLRRQA